MQLVAAFKLLPSPEQAAPPRGTLRRANLPAIVIGASAASSGHVTEAAVMRYIDTQWERG